MFLLNALGFVCPDCDGRRGPLAVRGRCLACHDDLRKAVAAGGADPCSACNADGRCGYCGSTGVPPYHHTVADEVAACARLADKAGTPRDARAEASFCTCDSAEASASPCPQGQGCRARLTRVGNNVADGVIARPCPPAQGGARAPAMVHGRASAHTGNPPQQTPASAEPPPVARPPISLETLAADLLRGERPAGASLRRHLAGQHRNRLRKRLAKQIASITASLEPARAAARGGSDKLAADLEAAAEGVEAWAYVRGFEAGHIAGQKDANEAASREVHTRQLEVLARQHSDAQVNAAERARRELAKFAGLPDHATWTQIMERAEALRVVAAMAAKWAAGGGQ